MGLNPRVTFEFYIAEVFIPSSRQTKYFKKCTAGQL